LTVENCIMLSLRVAARAKTTYQIVGINAWDLKTDSSTEESAPPFSANIELCLRNSKTV